MVSSTGPKQAAPGEASSTWDLRVEGRNTWETLRNLSNLDGLDRNALRGAFWRLMHAQRAPEALLVLKAMDRFPKPREREAVIPREALPIVPQDRRAGLGVSLLTRDQVSECVAALDELDQSPRDWAPPEGPRKSNSALVQEFRVYTANAVLGMLEPARGMGDRMDPEARTLSVTYAANELPRMLASGVVQAETWIIGPSPIALSLRWGPTQGVWEVGLYDHPQGRCLSAGAAATAAHPAEVGYAATLIIPRVLLPAEGFDLLTELTALILPQTEAGGESFSTGSAAQVARWMEQVPERLARAGDAPNSPRALCLPGPPSLRWNAPFVPPASRRYFERVQLVESFHAFLRGRVEPDEAAARMADAAKSCLIPPGLKRNHAQEVMILADSASAQRYLQQDTFQGLDLIGRAPLLQSPQPPAREGESETATSSPEPLSGSLPQPGQALMPLQPAPQSPALHTRIWEQGACPIDHRDVADWKSALSAMEATSPKGIHTADAHGNTALHVACAQHNFELVQLLVERGAYFATVNHFGVTPLDSATAPDFQRYLATHHLEAAKQVNTAWLEATSPEAWDRLLDDSPPLPSADARVRAVMRAGLGVSDEALDRLETREHLIKTVGHVAALAGEVGGVELEGDSSRQRQLTRVQTLCALLLEEQLPTGVKREQLLDQLSLLGRSLSRSSLSPHALRDSQALWQSRVAVLYHEVATLEEGRTAGLGCMGSNRHAVALAAHGVAGGRIVVACYNLGEGAGESNPSGSTRLRPAAISFPRYLLAADDGKEAFLACCESLEAMNEDPQEETTARIYGALAVLAETLGQLAKRRKKPEEDNDVEDVSLDAPVASYERRAQRVGNCTYANMEFMLQAQVAVALGDDASFHAAKQVCRAVKQQELARALHRLKGPLGSPVNVERRRQKQRRLYAVELLDADPQAAQSFVTKHPELPRGLSITQRQRLGRSTRSDALVLGIQTGLRAGLGLLRKAPKGPEA